MARMIFEYKRVEYERVADNVNIVKLSSVYDNPCGNAAFAVVNDETMKYIINITKKTQALYRTERNHLVFNNYDETWGGPANQQALVEDGDYSFIKDRLRESYQVQLRKCKSIIKELTNSQRDRFYVYSVYGLKLETIAECEGVSIEAVRKSCDIARDKLKMHSHFLLTFREREWANLLKSPNFKNYIRFFSLKG